MLKKAIYGVLGVSVSTLILTSLLVAMPNDYIGEAGGGGYTEVDEQEDDIGEDDLEREEDYQDGGDVEFDMPDLFTTYHLSPEMIDNLVSSNVFQIGRIDPMYYNSKKETENNTEKGPKFTWEDAEAETKISESETIGYDTKAEPAAGGDVLKSVQTDSIAERFKRYGVLPVSEEAYGISSEFGPRENPVGETKEKVFHTGLDIWNNNISGESIYSMLPGVVSYVGNNPDGYGQHIIIDHDGFKTLYAHLSTKPNYNVGDTVKAGDVLGSVGNTGRSTGAHLHIEINVEGVKINPKPFMSIVGSPGNKNKPKEVYVQAEAKSEESEEDVDKLVGKEKE